MMVNHEQSLRGAVQGPLLGMGVLLYSTTLHLTYKYEISPVFATRGLTYRTPDYSRYVLAVVLVAVVAFCLPRECRRASDVMQWLPFVMAGAPSILLPQYMRALTETEATSLGLTVSIGLLLCRALTYGSIDHRRVLPAPFPRIWVALVLFAGACYVYIATVAGVQLQWVSLNDVYDVRASFGAAVGGTFIPRILPWVYNVINPILMVRGILARRASLFMVGAAGQVLIYLWQGQKSVLFSILIVTGFSVLTRGRGNIPGHSFLYWAALLSLLSVAIDWFQGSHRLTDLFVRRTLVIPGAITVAYVAVFHDLEKSHFAELWLGSANPSYAAREPAFTVGRLFFGDPSTHANVNIWGHGYLNFGYFGIVLIAVLYALVLRLLDACTDGLPSPVIVAICAPMAMVISNANLFTTLLTHGLLAMMAICLFLPRTGWATDIRRPLARSALDR